MSVPPDLDLLRDGFVPEMRDLVETAAEALLLLETQPGDAVAVNDLFRVVHTIKGTAGMFDLPILVELVHAAEDLLGAVREGRVALKPEIVDDLLGCFDTLSSWVEAIDATGALPEGSADFARTRSRRYRGWLGEGDNGPQAAPEAAPKVAAPATTALPDWFDLPLRAQIAGFLSEADPAARFVLIRYSPRAECFFSGDDPVHLMAQVPQRLWFRVEPSAPWAPPESFDPYQCQLRFDLLSAAPRAEIDQLLRYVLAESDVIEIGRAEVFDGPFDPIAAELLATQFRLASAPGAAVAAIATAVQALFRGAGYHVTPEAVTLAVQQAGETGSDLPLRRLRVSVTGEPLALAEPPTPPVAPDPVASPPEAGSASDRALKIEPAKIDSLVDLVGELVVAKNALPFLAVRAEEHFGSRDLAREIKQHFAVLDRIAQDLQTSVMGIRMLPVAVIFKRFPRLVRDISRKLEKTVDLQIEGETTEADKAVIEALADPLLHLMRNSLDHGIEPPEERRAAGKPDAARLLLRAAQEGDKVVIRIEDDGRGIDPTKIRASALRKGLISQETAANLSESEAINLIFLPGFSTAETVSDLSGRGVGMDAVRHAIEGLGGTVRLSSVVGLGTTVELALPLTLVVSKVMAVEIAGQLYGVPMAQTAETVRIPTGQIRGIKGAELVHLRGALVPIVRLRERFLLEPQPRPEEAVLVVRIDGVPIGIVVDEFVSGMDVIMKPLGGILRGAPGYAGTAVLGDGRVLLVLNLKELL
ncbi:chemotaxis protein CheA [Rhodobacter capsulatus]|uniref:chemotaxis protein CheA n=1 Tax=Rhodobacter capsulatus TaxID=1061 RepID=UPI004026C583